MKVLQCCLRGAVLGLLSAAVVAAGEHEDLAKRFQAHIDYLAGDDLEGRGVGSRGIEAAAEYIARQFQEGGLEPAGDGGTYFQSFPIALQRKLAEGNTLTLRGDDQARALNKDFIPLSFSSSGAFAGKVVFCGYGIINPDRQHNDFARGDLKGKVALVFDGEPRTWADPQGNPTRYAMRRDKVYNVKDRGAVAILFVNPRTTPDEKDELTPFDSQVADDYGLPAVQITREAAAAIFKTSGIGNLDDIQRLVDGGLCITSDMRHIEAQGEVRLDKETAQTRNVVAALRGTARPDEWIVIGAHYDHLGLRRPMMRRFKEGRIVEDSLDPEIHNGADDNASGVSGLIEIARAMRGQKLDRSVLFVAFSAEETGLQGSKYFCDHPRAPLDQIVAMLNMDMIGRLGGGDTRVSVFGAKSASEFMEILQKAGRSAGLDIHPAVDSGGRSDHAVFLRKGIPSLHFYSGNHSDYHKPSDDAHLINADGGARIAAVVRQTAISLANMSGRLTPTPEPRDANAADPHAALAQGDRDNLPTYRVVMGLSPNYADDGKPGMGVDAVSAEGPAERAGMKAGDRIVRINGKPIANIYDYMASTRNNKAGDEVEVVVLRDGQEKALKITLAGAR